ncbi:hypothetical protein [Mycolicibacterium fortuitum]|uniref:Uncharacterized protein n=2 Tax=Mycolicibacterium fortuitum TaxID=1766 RepID=A0AAE4VGE7_MYCFO|nr:hypothetical protein [Mycolicibacterium fortuitum]MCV7142888.1 hypothetical protein [Mycolicibacterium fortuitum]MDV7190595.1 hypothetical protein [Mycolicibacterium fortuitum]MDV7207926.1 hypothetical protein [Mycolicibacterium fortuitum]MDV7229859.1 hypothetical protein [Mycolicibacterium fortuitum]MDV7257786.1 hypothetical protein [Mycolicibacterium fortuitum]
MSTYTTEIVQMTGKVAITYGDHLIKTIEVDISDLAGEHGDIMEVIEAEALRVHLTADK